MFSSYASNSIEEDAGIEDECVAIKMHGRSIVSHSGFNKMRAPGQRDALEVKDKIKDWFLSTNDVPELKQSLLT